MTSEIRKVVKFSDDAIALAAQVGAVMRDVTRAFARRPARQLVSRVVLWEVPWVLDVPLKTPPQAVNLVRAVNEDGGADGKPSGVAWTWDTAGRARVDDVDGVSVGTRYTMTFEVIE